MKHRGRVNYEANVPFQIRDFQKSGPLSQKASPNFKPQTKPSSSSGQKFHRGYEKNSQSIRRSPLIETPEFLKTIQLHNTCERSSPTVMKYNTPPLGGVYFTNEVEIIKSYAPQSTCMLLRI